MKFSIKRPPREPRTWPEGQWTVTEILRPVGQEKTHAMRNHQVPSWAAISLIGLGSVVCIVAGWYDSCVDSESSIPDRSLSAGMVLIGAGSLLGIISTLFP